MATYGEVLHIPGLPSPSSLSFYLLLTSLQVKVCCHLVVLRKVSGTGLASSEHRSGRPRCHHANENWSLFQPIARNFTSFALSAPRDLTCIEHIYTWHLKNFLRVQSPSLSPALTLILESSNPSTMALLMMGLGTLRRPLQPNLVSHQFRAAPSAHESISLEQSQGLVRWGLTLPCSGHFQTVLTSLPDMLHHTEHVEFFTSFLGL